MFLGLEIAISLKKFIVQAAFSVIMSKKFPLLYDFLL